MRIGKNAKPVVLVEFTFSDRVKQAAFGLLGGIGASIVTAWMSDAPWLALRAAQAFAWIASWHVLW